jgi:hypothetical protein
VSPRRAKLDPIVVSRLATFALVIATTLLVWSFVIAPFQESLKLQSAQLVERRELLSRLNSARTVSNTEPLKNQEAHYVPHFLQGGSDALILADLQSKLRALAIENDALINGAQELPRRTKKGMRQIGLRLQLEASLAGGVAILRSIDQQVPLLFVDRISISPLTVTPIPGGPSPGRLSLSMDVYGAVLTETD